jgi:hypothetical protein
MSAVSRIASDIEEITRGAVRTRGGRARVSAYLGATRTLHPQRFSDGTKWWSGCGSCQSFFEVFKASELGNKSAAGQLPEYPGPLNFSK